jgi:hypothetical protein
MTEKYNIFRLFDWEDRLSIYLDNCSDISFQWGEHDCVLFAATCIEKMCGIDIAKEYRGSYSDARGAAEALRTYGKGTIIASVTDIFGKSRHQSMAKRGDIVEYKNCLGICVGNWCWFIGENEGQSGLHALPTKDVSKCWHVPFEGSNDG